MATRAPSPRTRISAGAKSARPDNAASSFPWTFLTNHAHVLIHIAEEPAARMRDIADRVGITERAVQRIVRELEDAGYIERLKEGRRNHYRVTASQPLRHPIERHVKTSALLALVLGKPTR
ncbi:MAG: helix-turn-helix transcriptional regulator [Candidatus Binatia bacterium]